jgi:uncharacterized membrane protein YeaQ/YmgE (transglycosylase-associated protein family)
MYLSPKSPNNHREIIKRLFYGILLGGILAPLISYFKPPTGIIVSMFLGIFCLYGILMFPKRLQQLLAVVILSIISGFVPSAVLLSICYFHNTAIICQNNQLRAQIFGYFAFSAIFIIIPWLGSFCYHAKER